jgi:hypothetical protein
MKAIVIKADRLVLRVMTHYVRLWVERWEFKKHKIDFMLRFEWVQFGALVVWALLIPALLFAAEGHIMSGVFHVIMWSVLAAMDLLYMKVSIPGRKAAHDIIFAMREDPGVSKMVAVMLHEEFERSRRSRLAQNGVLFVITFGLFGLYMLLADRSPTDFVWQYIAVNAIANMIRGYIPFVNDFEPPKRKKKASQSITELVERLWGEFLGGLSPVPTYGTT